MTRCLIGFSCLVRSLANAVAPVSRKVAVAAVLLCLSAAGARAATWTVDTLNDDSTTSAAVAQSNCASGNSGTCALRDAILAASSGDTVTFSVTGTITLSSALPVITRNLSVVGPGANQLTISGAGQYQVFSVKRGLSISGVTIANGNAVEGGGIENQGTMLVTNCTFSGNTASAGGAIFNYAGILTVSGSTFMGNSASEYGGAIYAEGGLTVTDSTFSGNSAANGGGVYFAAGIQTVTNSTFVANSASVGGGGINLRGGTLNVNNSIFSGNLAPVAGGGIFNGLGQTVNAGNNVYFNNQNGDCFGCSDSGGSDAGSNPLALPLGYYGGTTETYLPQLGSAAICAGSAGYAAGAELITDQRGFALDASCEYSGNVDAGAVQTNLYVVTTLTDQTDLSPDCTSGTGSTCSLRDAIGLANTTPGDITFLPSLTSTTPGTITLGTNAGTGDIPLPAIDGQMNIIGPGANQLTISGYNDANVGSVFTVNSGATATLYGLTIANGNMSDNPGGGGIDIQGTLAVIASAVSANQASNGLPGGGISNAGTLTLTGSTVSGNTAAGGVGGGIFNAGTLRVTESTISGNADAASFQPGQGGGIDNGGTLTLTGSTVSGNSASCNTCAGGSSGGGIYSYGTLTASNSIVAGNTTAGTLGADDCDGCGTQSSSNLIGGTPELSQLQYNGLNATLQTMIPLPGSPAICAGLASNIPVGTTTDERGYPLQPTGGYCASGTVDAGAVQTNYTSVAFVQQPSNVAVNADISPSPTVEVLESDTLLSSNNTDAVGGIPITLTASGGTYAGSSLQATTSSTSPFYAAFSSLSSSTAAMGIDLTIPAITITGSTTLPSVISNAYDITTGPVAKFAVSAPGTATAGSPFSITVTAQDSGGNTFTGYTGTVSFTTTDTGAGVVLPAQYTFTTGTGGDNGVHTFTNAATLVTAGNQTITATDIGNSIQGTSGTIAVGAGAASILTAGAGTPQSAYVNTAFATALTASVADAYSNPVPDVTVSFTAPGSGASVMLSNAGSCITAPNGACSVTATANGTAGSYNVTASASGLTSVSFALTNNPPPAFVVTTLADQMDSTADCTSGTGSTCSLRDAITAANTSGAGKITFLSTLTSTGSPGTITLGTGSAGDTGLPAIAGYVNLIGPGANQLTISGNNDTNVGSVFTVNSGATAILDGLTITGGNALRGGGVLNQGTLNVLNCAISGNTANNNGGGIENTVGTLTVVDCTISGNTVGDAGGGISNEGIGSTVSIVESTIYGNSDPNTGAGGAGIFNLKTMTVTGSTIWGNTDNSGYGGGGIYQEGTLTLANSIVAGNTAAEHTENADAGSNMGGPYTDAGGNVIGGSNDSDSTQVNGTGATIPLSGLQYNGLNATVQTLIPLPGSPAICAGLASNIPSGTTTDERGNPLQPTNGYCPAGTVDAGAVQTDYALGFSAQPSPISPAMAILIGADFQAGVLLTESGSPFTAASVSIPLTLDGTGTLSGGSAMTSTTAGPGAGVASYSTLQVSAAGSSDTLTANLALNPGLSPPLAISATSAPFSVGQATPTITTPPTASAITYGQTLASSALTGGSAVSPITSANVPGSFAFATPSSTPLAGTQPESVTFTPNDTSDFSSVTSTVSVQVSKAPTNVTVLPIASAILSGQTLASSTLAGGTAVSTITGATVPGTFTFTTPSTAPTSTAGQSVTFTPTDANDFLSTATSVSVTVTPAQSITFSINAPASAAYNSIFTVAATASSGLPVAFTSSGSCTNVGAIYTMTSGTGTCSVIANQAGNTSYSAATTVIQATSATPAAQTITFSTNAPGSAAYNSSFTVAASGGASGNPVTYTSTGSCSSSSATYTMTSGTGSCSVIANQAGNTNFAAAPQVTETVNATPTAITASVTASNKVYDGTTTATITACTLIGVTIGDAGRVSCTANGPNTFASANPGTNITVTATNITLSGPAAGNYRLGSTTATTTASITYNFIGLEAPYAPPPTTFNVTRTMPLAWQYTNASGAVVNSAAANPTVQISGPYACDGTDTAADITINSAGASGYQYSSTTNTWQFNWQIKGNAPGCYNIYIVSGQTGQSSGPYPIEVVSH